MGLTFGGKRDLYAALGYQRILTPKEYRARYLRNGIAARVIDLPPQATWRTGGEVIEDENPEIMTDFETVWSKMDRKFHIWPLFQRVDTLAGLGRYAVLLIGAPGTMDTELPKGSFDQLAYFTPFAEEDAQISTLVLDPKNERFGLPEYYSITRLGVFSTAAKVHWTRIIHVADGLLDDQVYGTPRLERIWNLIDDLEKITGSGSEAFWLRAHQGYLFNLDKDMEIDPDEEQALKDETDEFVNGMRRVVRTRGMELKTLGSDVANFQGPVASLIEQISGSVGIPQRILLGSERGELASTQDRNNWYDQVHDRRAAFAGPYVVEPFVNRLMEYGYLPEAEYVVRWPQIQNLDEVQKADVALKWSNVNAAYASANMGIVVTAAEMRERLMGLPPIDPEELMPPTEEPVAEPVPSDEAPVEDPDVKTIDSRGLR
jgi:hypothetical protein